VDDSKKMHVLFLSYHLPLGNEPGAFRPWMEARLMARAGFAVTVVTSGVQYMTGRDIRSGKGWCTEEERDGIRILRTWAPSDHRRSLLRRTLNYLSYTILAGLASLLKVTSVHRVFAGTDPIFMMPMVYFISRIKRVGLILDERDLFPETAIALDVLNKGILSYMLFRMQQFFRRDVYAMLAATPGIRKRLIEYGHSPDKIYLLYNADVFLDEDLRGGTVQCSLRQQTGKSFLVGYAGGFGKANDIPTLLRAAVHLRDVKNIGIVLIGSGERRRNYKQYCMEKSLNNVFFFDAVPRHEVRRLLCQFDVCVQPLPADNHFSGTLTSKTFDYHGVGCPMIFCGSGDTATLLEESEGGVVVAPGDDRGLADMLIELYRDDERCRRMGDSAYRWFKQHIKVESGCAIMKKALECYHVTV
jgi:glycosyltransferase involved in cell wall biosynthesis